MADPEDRRRSEELQRKAEELRRKAFEDEARRLEEETERRARELARQRLTQEKHPYESETEEENKQREREEQLRKAQEEEVQRVLEHERQKRHERRRREEADQIRKEQEEVRRQEEHRVQEEVARQKTEEERLRKEQEKKRQEETEKKRLELDALRKEQERLRREVEKQDRVEALIKSAEGLYMRGDYEHAAIEVAKALVNDPSHASALTLEQKIKEAQGKKKEKPAEAKGKGERVAAAKGPKTPPPAAEKKRTVRLLSYAIVVGVIVLTTIVVTQLRKKIFTSPVGIAVLPWTSPSNILEDKILGTALAGELADEFMGMKPYLPMGFSSSYHLAQLSDHPEQAIFQIGCPYVLQGSIAQENNMVFVNLKLVDSTNNVVWDDGISRPSGQLTELPGAIATKITEVLLPAMGDVNEVIARSRWTVAPDAYLMYLRGKEMLQRPGPESTRNALDLFLQAVQQDNGFGEARAAAAVTLLERVENGWDSSSNAMNQAVSLAEAALKTYPTSGTAFAALGTVAAMGHNFPQSLRLLDTASLYLPRSGAIYLERAKVYFRMGKYNEVTDAMAHAYELDPRNTEILRTFAYLHQLMGTPRQGIGYHETVLSLIKDTTAYLCGPMGDLVLMDPGLTLSYSMRVSNACRHILALDSNNVDAMYRLAQVEQISGNYAQAAPILAKLEGILRSRLVQQPRSSSVMTMLSLTLTRLGRFPEADAHAARAIEIDKFNPDVYFAVARMYSLQMYSSKTNSVDAKRKSDAIRTLRQALAMSYRIDELASADFFNLIEQGALNAVLQETTASK